MLKQFFTIVVKPAAMRNLFAFVVQALYKYRSTATLMKVSNWFYRSTIFTAENKQMTILKIRVISSAQISDTFMNVKRMRLRSTHVFAVG